MKLPKELREKKDLGGSGSIKRKKCSVKGCGKDALRSLSEKVWNKYLERANLKIEENRLHKIFLCKSHYNEANKLRKKEDKLLKSKGFLDDSRSSKVGKYYEQ
ncbi:MAG: hypothetical protein ACTSR8_02050 [Promethearchaeota archaeon]